MPASTQMPRGNLYVDPSVMSVLVKSNLRKKAPTASKQKCLTDVLQSSCPASEGTDSTAEPDFTDITDKSETDSFYGSYYGCGRPADEVSLNQIHQTQQSSRGDNVRKANKSLPQWREGAVHKRSPNSVGKKGAGAFNDFEGANSRHGIKSSPEEFAAAWNVAAQAGAWKSDSRKTQSLKTQKEQLPQGQSAPRQSFHRQSSSVATSAAQNPRTEDLPMPKWFTPSCENIVAPLPVGIVRKPRAEQAVDQLVQIVQGAFQEGQFNAQGLIGQHAHGHFAQSTLDQELANTLGQILGAAGPARSEDHCQRNGGSDRPLKIHTPHVEFNAAGMNPDLPIKKRVPDWGF